MLQDSLPLPLAKPRPYYGWVIVSMAAASMVATLPARSVGLGLITEPLIASLNLSRTQFANVNVVATLLGSLFALAAGPLTDRWGIRILLSATLLILGGLVMAMGHWVTAASLTVYLVLLRGVGQSALSTISITSVGKWFTARLAIAMGVFSVMVAIGFCVAIIASQAQIETRGWRQVWTGMGAAVVLLGGISLWLTRPGPEAGNATAVSMAGSAASLTVFDALKTPGFWVFSIGMALYSGLLSGISLFNESILLELGFGAETFRFAMGGLMIAGLAGNLGAAWAARRFTLPRVMAVSLAMLVGVLAVYPALQSSWAVILHASAFGFCGGVFSVLFFTAFGHSFGKIHLGKIQGVAQVMTVLTSALGPWWLAGVQERAGSYLPAMDTLIPVFAVIAILAWFTKLPTPASRA
jgi:MFS family permease